MSSILVDHLISWMIAVPFLTIAVLLFMRNDQWVRRVALAGTLTNLGLTCLLWSGFDLSKKGMQFVERSEWMTTFNIEYAVGVDGISILLVLLTTLLFPLCVLASWKVIDTRVKAFMGLVLLVEGAMIVVFTALDMFLFFMLWEVTMIPMYFMIILWGGPGRVAAGIKFVLYSLTGSLLLLVGILGLYLQGGHSFDMLHLAQQSYSTETQAWIFLAFLLAFARQAPDGPVSFLASRRPFRSADGRQCDSGGCASEDGRLRVPALLPSDLAGRLCTLRPRRSLVFNRSDSLRWMPRARPVRHQEADRLLFHLAHGLRHDGHLRL